MSGAIDDDTRRAVASGRETAGAMLSSAQTHLQKVFIVAVVGLVGSIYVLRRFVWDMLKRDLFSRMSPEVRESTQVVAITPFDVILLQVKIGIVVGLVLALPVFLWYSRDALRSRGIWPSQRVARWKIVVVVGLSLLLLAGGLSYAYYLFFPLMFDFLASNAIQVGFTPTYSIVEWAQFIFLLMLSFGLAAQLPLVMSALSYGGVVPYETFRDKWRYAVIGIFLFGALFSPPDPFTQIMWALPLILLYGFSLQLTKTVTIAKRSSDQVDVPEVARERWNLLAGVGFVAFVVVYAFFARGGIELANSALESIPAGYRPDPLVPLSETTGLANDVAAALVGAVVAVLVAGVSFLYYLSVALDAADRAKWGDRGAAPASSGSPADIDLRELDAAGVRTAPPEAFDALTEEEAVGQARTAMDEDQPEKARAILDRFDEAQERAEAAEGEGEGEGASGEGDADATAEAAAGVSGPAETGEEPGPGEAEEGESGSTVNRTLAGMMSAFTDEETTEDDIGGYYYDIAFILDSLTSKAFRLVAVFMAVLASSFIWLYQGGIKRIKDTFFARMPAELQPNVDIVTLHPVEALIFEIKFSTLLAIVAVMPLVLYYAWPALKERGFVRGDARVLLVWGVTLIVGVIGGSALGFLYIAPGAISWLATDVLRADMIIAYRINNFGWLVIYTTVFIGLLFEIPVTMLLFHRGGIVSYHTMQAYWRQVVVGIFAASALLSPRGVFTMLILAIPAAFAYAVGLGLLWAATFGGRRGGPAPTPDDAEAVESGAD